MTTSKNEQAGNKPMRIGRGTRSKDPRVVVSAGIKTSEQEELQAIADSYGLTVGAVVTYFVRHSLELHRARKFKIPTVTKTIVKG